MSTTSHSYGTENSDSADCKTTEDGQSDNSEASCTYWVRHDGREFITDPNGDVVNLARLTAYAEHGEEIHEAQAHHAIPPLKIDAPAFIEPVTQDDHLRLHKQDLDPVEVDGFPILQTGT